MKERNTSSVWSRNPGFGRVEEPFSKTECGVESHPVVFMTRDLSLKSVAQAIFRMSELHIEVARN